MTIAQQIVATCNGAETFTLAGGYVVPANGDIACFERGRALYLMRDREGHVIEAQYCYSDGSRIAYQNNGFGRHLKALPVL